MLRRKSLFFGISEQEVRFLMGSTENFKDIVTVTLVAASDNTFGAILQLELFEILHAATSVIKITVSLSHLGTLVQVFL